MELSFSEMLLVAVIAFIVLGPEEMVRRSQQLGRWVGKMRSEARNFGIMAQESLIQKAELEKIKKKIASENEILADLINSESHSIEQSVEKNLFELSLKSKISDLDPASDSTPRDGKHHDKK